MIVISKKAELYFRTLLQKEDAGTQIRIFVQNVGTNQAEGKVTYCLKDEIRTSDSVFYYVGFCIYINKEYLPYLKNAYIDLITDKLEERLILKAPYVKQVLSEKLMLNNRVEDFLEYHINPQLSNHGGYVKLINITDEGYIILEFGGGCNGCSMITMTLKDGIEKKILLEFPNLKGVQDITNHNRGNHSFY
ncbi:Fe/S biogenesis protein NfuA [Buchnera aphidicola (Eriosoma grossulariae)]|uniref:NfuA family Fe-S biogenesis protein n=1 Tax=Buchnera aphidicola TaxID=9 RepID=UPI003463D6E5